MGFEPPLAFIAVARLCEFDWDAHGLHVFFHCEYMTVKLRRIGGSAPMVHKLADGTEEKIAGTDTVRSIYSAEFAMRGTSFYFARADWLQYLQKKVDYFGVPSHEARHAELKRLSSLAASVLDYSQVSLAAAGVADDPDNDDDYWE